MKITVNGEPLELSEGVTVPELLQQLEMGQKRIALEINREILPRSQYDGHALKTGDRIEIVQAIGGG
jgi:thiamine biosynthesis protein ThiS